MKEDDDGPLHSLSLAPPIPSTSATSLDHSSLNPNSLARQPPSPTSPSPTIDSFNQNSTNLYLQQQYLPPLPHSYDQQQLLPSTSVSISSSSTISAPIPTSKPFQTGSSSSQEPASMPIIQFDPRGASLSDDEDDDDDEDAGVQGRPRKRKSTVNLRAQAQSQQSGTSGAQKTSMPSMPPGMTEEDAEEKGRRKIQIEYIEEKSKRHITFSKRKAGIMKKAYELSTLTGTQVLLLVVSESGWVYTFTTDKFKPLVKEDEHGQLSQGQKLIAACLEAKENVPNLDTYQTVASSAPSASFESNSSIHGGQIALKTRGGPVGNRPTATNRRVSSKGRNHIPTAIRTDGGGMPPVPHLPTPMSGYLDPALQSPISPHGPGSRSRSHPPVSPNRVGMHHMQQQQQQMMGPGGGPGSASADYAEMLQRTDMLQMQQGPYDHSGQWSDNMYSSPPPSSHAPHHPNLMSMAQHDSHFQQQQQQQQQQRPYEPHYDQQQHYPGPPSSQNEMHQGQRPMLHQQNSGQY